MLVRTYASKGPRTHIEDENLNAGDASWATTSWDWTTCAAYGSKISVQPGGSLDLYVSSTVASCTVKVYRLGWYGGDGGRLMSGPTAFTATNKFAQIGLDQTYSIPPTSGVVLENTWAEWDVGATISVGSNWLTGYYIAVIDNGTRNWWVPFIVYDPNQKASILVRSSDTTWQAYNDWNSRSIYTTTPRAYRVSYDRPFHFGSSNPSFGYYDLSTVRWLEKNGYDVAYCACQDVDADNTIIRKFPVALSIGHDEYWSQNMRDGYDAAVAAGTSLGFFGANACYSKIRFLDSEYGTGARRCFETYKVTPTADPQYPTNTATNYRSISQPENTLIGVLYRSLGPVAGYPWVCSNPSHWAFAGTGMASGDAIPGACGYEYDVITTTGAGASPSGLETLATSPVVDSNSVAFDSHSTFYSHASGAGVWASGSIYWGLTLDFHPFTLATDLTNIRAQRITQNVLDRLIRQGRSTL